MKQKIYNLFPGWITKLKHGDKIVHAILGTIIYGLICIFSESLYALITIIAIGISIEIYDKISRKGTPDALDAIATFIIPLLIYFI